MHYNIYNFCTKNKKKLKMSKEVEDILIKFRLILTKYKYNIDLTVLKSNKRYFNILLVKHC